MKESFWGILVILIGIVSIYFVFFFQSVTNTDEHNYNLLKEVTEASMYDAVDLASYKAYGVIRINREKFVESFVRRYAESANLSRTYYIQIYDVNETPPKVSIKVSSIEESKNMTGNDFNIEIMDIDIVNKLDSRL